MNTIDSIFIKCLNIYNYIDIIGIKNIMHTYKIAFYSKINTWEIFLKGTKKAEINSAFSTYILMLLNCY